VYHTRTREDLLERLWGREMQRVIGFPPPTKVFGISKGSLAAMKLQQTQLTKTTSIAEPLDAVLERLRKEHSIECFVVTWDLVPPWDKEAKVCRWNETLGLYEGLSLSRTLDRRFREFAANRFREMRRRVRPSSRATVPQLVNGGVFPVCVDPLFESVFMNERDMKRSLGVSGRRMRGWPSGWDGANVRASEVIGTAVDAARDAAPRNPVFRRIRQGYETLKTEWGIHFVESGAFDQSLRQHPLGQRLAEVAISPKK
jgi:hypothetical protein